MKHIKIDRRLCAEGAALHEAWHNLVQRGKGRPSSEIMRGKDDDNLALKCHSAAKAYFKHRNSCPNCDVMIIQEDD